MTTIETRNDVSLFDLDSKTAQVIVVTLDCESQSPSDDLQDIEKRFPHTQFFPPASDVKPGKAILQGNVKEKQRHVLGIYCQLGAGPSYVKGKGTNIKDTAAARIGWFKKGLDKLSSLGDKLKSVGFNSVTAGDDSIYYGCITEWAEEHPTVKIIVASQASEAEVPLEEEGEELDAASQKDASEEVEAPKKPAKKEAEVPKKKAKITEVVDKEPEDASEEVVAPKRVAKKAVKKPVEDEDLPAEEEASPVKPAKKVSKKVVEPPLEDLETPEEPLDEVIAPLAKKSSTKKPKAEESAPEPVEEVREVVVYTPPDLTKIEVPDTPTPEFALWFYQQVKFCDPKTVLLMCGIYSNGANGTSTLKKSPLAVESSKSLKKSSLAQHSNAAAEYADLKKSPLAQDNEASYDNFKKYVTANIPEGWEEFFTKKLNKNVLTTITEFLARENEKYEVYPPIEEVFTVFNMCKPCDIKVLIIGQDPYHTPGAAMGIAFAHHPGTKMQPSVQNIYKELESDGFKSRSDGDLRDWVSRGVFLINTALTVRKGQAGSHGNKANDGNGRADASHPWYTFTSQLLRYINDVVPHMVVIMWGSDAQAFSKIFADDKHSKISSYHPSPFSAHKGFFKSKPFSKANKLLKKWGVDEVDWNLS